MIIKYMFLAFALAGVHAKMKANIVVFANKGMRNLQRLAKGCATVLVTQIVQ